MSKREIYQGQIYICDLGDNNIGSEQSGERPCLVIQNNILNATSEIIIVIPITSKCKKVLPTHYILTNDKYSFLTYDKNTVLCECIRSLSKKRIKKLIGQIDNDDLKEILKTKEYAYKKVWIAPTMHGKFYGGGMIPTPEAVLAKIKEAGGIE